MDTWTDSVLRCILVAGRQISQDLWGLGLCAKLELVQVHSERSINRMREFPFLFHLQLYDGY